MTNFSLVTGTLLVLERGADGNPIDEELILILYGGTAAGGAWIHIEVLSPDRLRGRRLNMSDQPHCWLYDPEPQSDDGFVINGPCEVRGVWTDEVDCPGDNVEELHGLWLSEFWPTSIRGLEASHTFKKER